MRRHVLREGLLILLLSISGAVLAQSQLSGTIRGTVSDADGQSLPGVTISFQSDALIQARTIVSNENGSYRAPLLPPGEYKLTFTMTGFKTATRIIRLGLAETSRLDVTLELGGVEETITVTSSETGLEEVTVATNFDYEDVDKLPITNRRIDNVAVNAPAVAVTFNGDIQIAGANTFENNFLLNGADIGDNYFGAPTLVYIEEAVAETQVLTSGISARYGRFTGGVINAITKTGSNRFEGSVRAQYTNGKWNASNPISGAGIDDLGEEYQATLGGPIIKDKLWFFVAAHEQPSSTAQLNLSGYTWASGGSLASPNFQERVEGKLTWGINENHTVTAGYLEFESGAGPPRAGLPAADPNFANTGIRADERTMLSLQYRGIINNSWFLDVQYSNKEASIASGGDPNAGNPIYYQNEFIFYNNHWWDGTDLDERNNETYSINANYFLDTSLGSHNFNIGFQSATGTTGGENRQSATGTNFLILGPKPAANGNTPDQGFTYTLPGSDHSGRLQRWVSIPLGGEGGSSEANLEQTSLYFDDEWTFNTHWTMNIGLRWDDYQGEGPSVSDLIDVSDISPRVGVSYDVRGDGEYKVNATYGKYVGRFSENISNNGTGIGAAPRLIETYIGPTVVTSNPNDTSLPIYDDANWVTVLNTDPRVATSVDPDSEAAYSTEFTVGFSKTFGNGGSFGVTYIDREYKRLYEDFVGDVGQVTANGSLLDVTIWGNSVNGTRQYQGLVFDFQNRSDNWNYGGNVTWAELEGNHTGQGTNQPGIGTIAGDYPRAFPEDITVQYGNLIGDVPLRSRVWGVYNFNFGRFGQLDLGGLFRYQAGDVFNQNVTINLPAGYENPYTNTSASFNYAIGGRGNNRFPDYYTADFSINYQLGLYKGVNWYFKGTAVNVFNHIQKIGYNTSVSLTSGTGVLAYEGDTVTGWAVAPQADLGASYGQATNAGHYGGVRTIQLVTGFRF
jgi:hypothetical protein